MTVKQDTHVETVNTSNITAGGDVTIKATAGDVNLKATNINADDVTLDAAKNLNIESAQNKMQSDTKTSSSSASIGASFGLSGTFNGITGSVGASKGKENQATTTNTESIINASGTITLKSGNDTNIIGSQVKGEKVVAEVGGDLNIVSKQDTDTFTSKNQGGSIGFSAGHADKSLPEGVSGPVNRVTTGGTTGSISNSKMESTYSSVVDQAGIFAGKQGVDVKVGDTTTLVGGVISSTATPDKVKISTDKLNWMDLHNKAKYSASSNGMGYSNTGGFAPIPSIPVNGKADSTTKSAISLGTIEVRSGNTDISKINRNTDQALNALGKIFDKETVKEQKELVNLFSQEANKAIGDLAESMWNKASTPEEKAKWAEGGEYKALLHAVVGGITSSLSGSGFASGAAGDGLSQLAQGELSKITDKNLRLIASAAIGAAAAKVVGGNAQVGAGAAHNGVKYNDYIHRPTTEGSIIHKENGYYVVKNGELEPLPNGPKVGQVFWEDDGTGNGYEYILGEINPETGKPDHIYFTWSTNPVLTENGPVRVAWDDNKNPISVNGKVIGNPNDIAELQKELQQAHDAALGTVGGGTGFKTFKELKAFLGSPGVGNQWHHIVEQAQQNASRAGFTADQINSVENIIALQSGKGSVHGKISGYYSSVQDFTKGKTVRDWLSTKSFQEQFEEGMKILRRYGDVNKNEFGQWIFKPFE